jgi:hypothetical protein
VTTSVASSSPPMDEDSTSNELDDPLFPQQRLVRVAATSEVSTGLSAVFILKLEKLMFWSNVMVEFLIY